MAVTPTVPTYAGEQVLNTLPLIITVYQHRMAIGHQISLQLGKPIGGFLTIGEDIMGQTIKCVFMTAVYNPRTWPLFNR